MSEQIKIIKLNCVNCGGALEIHGDMDQFACGYCGSPQIVERRGGTIALRRVVDAVARVQVGTDKTAAELALVRLEKEIASIYAQWQTERERFIRAKNTSFRSFLEFFNEYFKGVNYFKVELAQFDAKYQKRLGELNESIKKQQAIVNGP